MNIQILKVLHYIETNINEDLDVNTLAKIAGYSPYYFCRIFKVSVGESVISYASRLRIRKASLSVINSEKSIIEIALNIGFQTPNGFNKAFKKIFDMTPTEYRKKHNQLLLNYKENRMNTPKIIQREATYIVYNSKFGTFEDSSMRAWIELSENLNADKKLSILSNNELLGICFGDPEIIPSEKLQYDAAISCKEEEVLGYLKDGFSVRQLEGGSFVTVTYLGFGSNKAWKDLFSWLVENNLSNKCKNMPPFEKYLNWNPNVEDDELIKEIHIPIN